MNDKLDLHLRSHAAAHRERLARRREGEPPVEAKRIDVILECRGPVSDLESVGLIPRSVIEHPTEHYKIITGTIPADRLEDLAAIDHVVVVEGPQPMHPLLDYSVPQIHADVLRKGVPSRQGKGVVIGIIDSGIDWRHKDFTDPATGNSRILAIWDQNLDPKAGEKRPDPPFDKIGVEYITHQINVGLKGEVELQITEGQSGHGTHVAGIAAGNGGPATCCHGGNTFIGVAPAASLIVVRPLEQSDVGENTHVADALNYIFGYPLVVGKPCVVNISLGSNIGAHDGTATVERAIDALVAMGPGRAVVVAAGNSAALGDPYLEQRSHVTASVPQGPTDIEFHIRSGHESDVTLDLWYDQAGSLNLQVVADGGVTSPIVNDGASLIHPHEFIPNPGDDPSRQIMVEIAGNTLHANGRDSNFRVTIHKPRSGNLPEGNWKLRVINPNAAAVKLHCWINRGKHAPVFLPPADPPDGKIRASVDTTLTMPATAAGAISVANHLSKTSWCDCWPSQDIEPSSSRGPVARNAAANPKPDIAAPGLEIMSAKADACNLVGKCCSCCPDACCCLYQDETGTSMSAPHVTGTVALMLEANANLTKADILTHLQHSAQPAPAGGTRETWGAGKLDALAAVNEILALGGGGGGGGGGHIMRDSPDNEFSHAERRLRPERRMTAMANGAPSPSPNLWLENARAQIESLPDGLSLAASISRHFSEVRRLINHNRRIAAMWHRTNGPRMLRRLVQCSCETSAPAFVAAEGHRRYFDRWCDLLMQHGSRQLRESLERHRVTIATLAGLQTVSPLVEAEAARL